MKFGGYICIRLGEGREKQAQVFDEAATYSHRRVLMSAAFW